jgi:hypothetical protein
MSCTRQPVDGHYIAATSKGAFLEAPFLFAASYHMVKFTLSSQIA